MTDHITNRNKIVEFLKSELVGPCLNGEELDVTTEITFSDWKSAFKPWIQKGTREEIIQGETPTTRYGIGVLYPIGIQTETEDRESSAFEEGDSDKRRQLVPRRPSAPTKPN